MRLSRVSFLYVGHMTEANNKIKPGSSARAAAAVQSGSLLVVCTAGNFTVSFQTLESAETGKNFIVYTHVYPFYACEMELDLIFCHTKS